MSWITECMEETSAAEAPEKYFWWSFVAAISAVAGRKIFLDKFLYKLYPSVYVFLTGESGIRKGYPITLCRKLVNKTACTKVIAGRGSIQGIVRELGKVYTMSNGNMVKDACGFFCTGELSASLVKDPDTLVILIDLYDCHYNDEWKNILKSVPIEKLNNVYLTILAASNETNLQAIVPKDASGSGFIARTFFVNATVRRGINSLMYKPDKIPNVEEMCKHLTEVSKLKGEFKMTDDAREHYDEWYKDLMKKNPRDSTGTLERIHDGILKVAMAISLSDGLNMVIEEKHIVEAEEKCMDCIVSMKQVVMGSTGKSQLSDQTAALLKELIRRPEHSQTRQRLLSKFWGDFDSIDLDRMVQTLTEAGAIDVHRNGKDIVYRITDKALELYTKFRKEEQ